MLPELLTLKGFLSYREKNSLDFTKFHVALVTGNNGHGKSTLLDAITFALFSMARGVEGNKRGITDLVSNGEPNLYVSLRFRQNGNLYRVTRTYDKIKGGSNVILEEEIGGNFKNISENTIRETDDCIEHLLGVNYDTFVTSSFVMQNQSDYFTSRNPTERIEILREMLSLGIYEEARDSVRESLHELDIVNRELAVQVSDGNEELKGMKVLIKTQSILNERIKVLKDKESQLKKELTDISDKVMRSEKIASEMKQLAETKEGLLTEIEDKTYQKEELLKELERLRNILDRERQIRASYAEFIKVSREYENLLEIAKNVERLTGEINNLKTKMDSDSAVRVKRIGELNTEIHKVEEKIQQLSSQIESIRALKLEENVRREELKGKVEELNLKKGMIAKRINDLQEELKQLNELRIRKTEIDGKREYIITSYKKSLKENKARLLEVENNIKQKDPSILSSKLKLLSEEYEHMNERYMEYNKQYEQLSHEKAVIENDIRLLGTNIKELKEKLDLLNKGQEFCPLCGSPLSDEHRDEIKNNYNVSLKEAFESLNKKKVELERIVRDISSLDAVSKEDVDRVLKDLEGLRSEYLMRENLCDEYRTERQRYEEEIGRLNGLLSEDLLTKEETEEYARIIENIEIFIRKEREEKEFEIGLKDVEREIEEAKEALNSSEKKISISERDERNLLSNINELREKIEGDKALMEGIRSELESPDFLREERQKVKALQDEIERIHYEPKQLEELREKRERLSNFGDEFLELISANTKSGELRKSLSNTEREIEGLKKKKEKIEERFKSLSDERESLAGVKEDYILKSGEFDRVEGEILSLSEEMAKVEEQLKKARETEIKVIEATGRIRKNEDEIKILKVVNEMFGKEGIPIAIIRSVLPQIESLSNELLFKMTEGKMQLKFSTLKSGKSGERNTFEIDVYDRGERRRYELFSGGEQFRINLAIRIGISLFLSSISGSQLEMLVVDEGFGSQDEAGRESILKEINSIKDRFKKILVVTHIGEIKESFPYEIRVVKDNYTSRLYVV